jgi:hypothetical protein
MRTLSVVSLLIFLLPAAALAQGAASGNLPQATRTARGGDITKEEYIERARRAAERRFDRMDTNHDGVLTAEERRAAREQRQERRARRSQ